MTSPTVLKLRYGLYVIILQQIEVNLGLCTAVLSGREWLNLEMRGTFDRCCTAWARKRGRSNRKRGRKLRRSKFYERVLAKEHQCFYCAVLSYAYFEILSSTVRSPEQERRV